jgi:peroxiredoxin
MGAAKARYTLGPGDPAPAIDLPLLAGGRWKLAEALADGPVVLAFFKISCPVCQLALPYLERIHRAGGLAILGVSQNGAEDTEAFHRAFGIGFPSLLDPENSFPVSDAFGITNVPTLFVVERDGRIGWTVTGWVKQEMEKLAARAGMGTLFRAEDSVPAWKAG